jgi:hypothetical protein
MPEDLPTQDAETANEDEEGVDDVAEVANADTVIEVHAAIVVEDPPELVPPLSEEAAATIVEFLSPVEARNDSRVQRFDRGELRASVVTAEGFILCEGYIAKPGVMEYLRGDGTIEREYIPAEELHQAASLATLGRKPVTLEHPIEDVVPENVGQYGVGDVDGDVEVCEGGFVRVRMAIRRVDAISAVRDGVQELSPGYTCRIDATPGVHPVFGRYDAIQRDRRYNHVAITDAARGGPSIRLRADSARQLGASMNPKLLALLLALKVARRDEGEGVAIDEAMVKVAEMQAGLAESMPAIATVADLKAKIAVLEAELAAAKATLTAVDAAKAETAKAEPAAVAGAIEDAIEADPMKPPEEGMKPPEIPLEMVKIDAIQKAVGRVTAERARLETLAAHLRIDAAEVATLGNRSLRKKIVLTANPSARTDAKDEYFRAAVDMLAGAQRLDAVDPYAELGARLARGPAAGAGARTDDKDEAPATVGFLANIDKQFKDRHAR